MEYVIQKTDGSYCPKCYQLLDLLIKDKPSKEEPMFYICFDCVKVFQIGVGEVRREDIETDG
jgi:hypothetical protein